ncbi:MAG: protein kinase [Gemmatimonadales bacterium]
MSEPLVTLTAALADRYTIERELGHGGMATVYLAHDIKHDRQVAIKVLKPELAAVISDERFMAEIKTTAALQHPHILPLFDSGRTDSDLYYVMPFVDGETLRTKLDREAPLDVDEAVKITTDIAKALHYAHSRGVIHRDIKPENILLADGWPMVADFGIAFNVNPPERSRERLTTEGMAMGTPEYMSPEQAVGERELTPQSDLYSLAIMLYEMLAGVPPFSGPSWQSVIAKQLSVPVPSVRSANPAVPAAVEAAITRALAKRPEDRFRSVEEFVAALAPSQADPVERASVAVLPFRLVGTGVEDQYFADGITEDVIAHLSKLKNLSVIARNSVMPFRDRDQPISAIASRLNVATVLDGSIRRAGARVRVVVQLIDAETGRSIWAETYDRDLIDIFAIQTDVALQIASALEAELSADERSRVHKEPTADLQAYTLYLQGRHAFGRFTATGLHAGVELFERAIGRDPQYALAWTGIAISFTEMAEGGMMAPDEAYRRARAAVENALLLDPGLGEAHSAAAYLMVVNDFDWIGAEAGYRRALDLNPNSADIHDLVGRFYSAMGRHDEALKHLHRAHALDPLTHKLDVATELLRAERFEEALAAVTLAVEVDPDYSRARATLGWALFLSGRVEEGIDALRIAATLPGASVQWLAQLGEAYGLAGRTEEAREVLHTLEELAQSTFVSPYHLAFVHIGLGDHERALDLLQHAVTERSGAAYGIRASFLLKPLHGHARFEALVRRINL